MWPVPDPRIKVVAATDRARGCDLFEGAVMKLVQLPGATEQ
jgi:hypothetical protein